MRIWILTTVIIVGASCASPQKKVSTNASEIDTLELCLELCRHQRLEKFQAKQKKVALQRSPKGSEWRVTGAIKNNAPKPDQKLPAASQPTKSKPRLSVERYDNEDRFGRAMNQFNENSARKAACPQGKYATPIESGDGTLWVCVGLKDVIPVPDTFHRVTASPTKPQ